VFTDKLTSEIKLSWVSWRGGLDSFFVRDGWKSCAQIAFLTGVALNHKLEMVCIVIENRNGTRVSLSHLVVSSRQKEVRSRKGGVL
jgi:hypothetical protein